MKNMCVLWELQFGQLDEYKIVHTCVCVRVWMLIESVK